jgi:beta-glucosidase/6-phospho-beta-glucosidase/beta-galactosidase
LPAQEFHQVCHHAVLAHGLAVQAIRAKGRQGTKIGPAENIELAVPLIEGPEHIKAAEAATREFNAPYLTVMLEGRKAKEIYITENGCAGEDVLADDGEVYDTERLMFLRAYLTQLQRATSDGVPVKGYFHWSMMDNFEWIRGYGNRYGMVYVDFKTQKRTPRMSGHWFRETAKQNAVV